MRGGELNRTATPGRTPEAAAGMSAGSRGRQTAPHDPIRTGTHGAGHECGGAEPHGGSRTDTGGCGGNVRRSRGRQTAPHDRIRTGTHDAGHECGGGLNRTAAPGIGGGPHAPTALRTTTVGITDRRGDT